MVAAISGSTSAGSSIDEYRGLARRSPVLAGSFTVLLLGLAGLPVTSGFIAKFGVFKDAWEREFEWLVVVAVVASVIAFAFYIRVIVVMYMNDPSEETPSVAMPIRWVLGIAVVATIVLGVLPEPLLEFAADALPL